MDNPDRLLSVLNEALLTSNFTSQSLHRSFSLFKNVCERSWRYLQPIARKKDLISVCRGALVSGNVNSSVYFNKLANNF